MAESRVRALVPTSLRARLMAAVAAVGAVLVLAAAVGLPALLSSELDQALDEGLAARATQVASAWQQRGAVRLSDPFAQVVAPGNRVLARSRAAPERSLLTAPELARGRESAWYGDAPLPGLGGDARILVRPAARGAVVVVAESRRALDRGQQRLLIGMLAAVAALVAALTLGTGVLVGAALGPVGRMTAAADRMVTDPAAGGQLPIPPGQDELTRLALTLNRLLAGLAESLARERALVDDASHELRTPLTVVRGELELALDEADPREQRRDVERALDEVARLSALAEDLLVLARETAGTQPPQERVALVPWLRGLLADAPAPGLDVAVEGGDGTALLDRPSMARAVSNVLRNSAAAGARRVRIDVAAEDDRVVLRLHDDGPGFPPGLVAHVFDRFVRGEPTRARPAGLSGTSGTGLGLAIVRAVAEAHGGTVRAANDGADGGAVVELRLPAG